MSDPISPPSSPLGYESTGALTESDPGQRSQAMVAHLLGIIGILGPGIFYLLKKNDSTAGPFVKDQAKEALNFEILVLLAWVALIVIAVILAVIVPKLLILVSLLYLVIFFGNIALVVMAGMKANKGIAARYPYKLAVVK